MELELIKNSILDIRGKRVILDYELAKLYGIETKRLKESVRRNIRRFPEDFMFELSHEEWINLRSQFATSSWGWKRFAPFAFTEQGVAMLSSVLNSDTAIEINISIMRAFVLMRQWALEYHDLQEKLTDLEKRFGQKFTDIEQVLNYLIQKDQKQVQQGGRKRIGFWKKYKNGIIMELELIKNSILEIRGKRVILDYELAKLYEVETKALKQAVRRNIDRFPEDFMFQLTKEEWKLLRSQSVTLEIGKGYHPKYLPFAFTEQGVAMLSAVLNSQRAVQTSVLIMRAFVLMRQWALEYQDLQEKLSELEQRFGQKFTDIEQVLNYLIQKDQKQVQQGGRKRIGFWVKIVISQIVIPSLVEKTNLKNLE